MRLTTSFAHELIIIKCFHFFVFTQIALSFLALSYLIMHLIINIFLHAQLNNIFKAILAGIFFVVLTSIPCRVMKLCLRYIWHVIDHLRMSA